MECGCFVPKKKRFCCRFLWAQLTGAFDVGNGWVAGAAGGCWDDDIASDYGSFPKIPY